MKWLNCLFVAMLLQHFSHAQHNFLGKTQNEIVDFFATDQDFSIRTDTISLSSILLTIRPYYQYPFYTYEISSKSKTCVSYGLVSKNSEVLQAYLDLLEIAGEPIENSSLEKITYAIHRKDGNSYYYTITQPYFNSDVEARRRIFYILVSEKSY